MIRRGRPSLYRPEHCALARQHCQKGASNDALACLLGVAPRSIDNWIARMPEFAAAVREGRAAAEAAAMQALFRRAMGYQETVERIVCSGHGYTSVTYTRHHLPEVRACKRWLCLRRPQNWRRDPHAALPAVRPSGAPASTLPAAHQFTVMDDARVANALYERAVGSEQTVDRVMMCGGVPRIVTYVRRHPPNTAASIFWLINKRPQNWSLRPGLSPRAATGVPTAHKLARPLAALGVTEGIDPKAPAIPSEAHRSLAVLGSRNCGNAQIGESTEKSAPDRAVMSPVATWANRANASIRSASKRGSGALIRAGEFLPGARHSSDAHVLPGTAGWGASDATFRPASVILSEAKACPERSRRDLRLVASGDEVLCFARNDVRVAWYPDQIPEAGEMARPDTLLS